MDFSAITRRQSPYLHIPRSINAFSLRQTTLPKPPFSECNNSQYVGPLASAPSHLFPTSLHTHTSFTLIFDRSPTGPCSKAIEGHATLCQGSVHPMRLASRRVFGVCRSSRAAFAPADGGVTAHVFQGLT